MAGVYVAYDTNGMHSVCISLVIGLGVFASATGCDDSGSDLKKDVSMNLTTQKVKRVGLVGHCSPDSSHLTMAINSAVPGAKVIRVTDDAGTDKLLADGVDLLLVNRAMEHGYSEAIGTDYIRKLKAKAPDVPMMLISNFADAQEAAVKEGAIPGFGKNAVMSDETKKKLQDALKD